MLTSSELAAMRTTAGSALPGTAVIYGGTFVSDGGGGGSIAYVAQGTVDCRLAPLARGEDDVEGERLTPDADSIITLPFDASVDSDSRLVIDGETYHVANIRDRSWNLTTRLEAVKR